jgi:copper chaperone
MDSVTYRVEGMSCEHCQHAVKQALESVEGVRQADVDLAGGLATVSLDGPAVDTIRLRQAVDEAGYTLVEQ